MSSGMASKSVRLTGTGIFVLLIGGLLLLYAIYTFFSAVIVDRAEVVNMKELLVTCIDLAVRGGNRLWSIRRGHSSGPFDKKIKGKTKEGADELLTKGDLESHRIIRHGFSKAFPQLKVISEEHDATSPVDTDYQTSLDTLPTIELFQPADIVPVSDVTIWIDPLDATQEYTEDLLHYVTTMVCVAVKGIPTIGVIYQPFNKLIVWGYVGHGVSSTLNEWMENKKMPSQNMMTRIIVSRSHTGNVRKLVEKALGENVQVISAGGAGYKVLQVVNSSAEVNAYVHTTRIKKWDICAGNAILSALGGNMTTLSGQTIDYKDSQKPQNDNGLLATLKLHDHFLEVFSHFTNKSVT